MIPNSGEIRALSEHKPDSLFPTLEADREVDHYYDELKDYLKELKKDLQKDKVRVED